MLCYLECNSLISLKIYEIPNWNRHHNSYIPCYLPRFLWVAGKWWMVLELFSLALWISEMCLVTLNSWSILNTSWDNTKILKWIVVCYAWWIFFFLMSVPLYLIIFMLQSISLLWTSFVLTGCSLCDSVFALHKGSDAICFQGWHQNSQVSKAALEEK